MRFIELTLTVGKKKILINTRHIMTVIALTDGVGSGVEVNDRDSYQYKVDESYQEVCGLVRGESNCRTTLTPTEYSQIMEAIDKGEPLQ